MFNMKTYTFVCCVFASSINTVNAKAIQDEKIVVTTLERFALVEQVSAMQGFDIRARKIVVSAGGSIDEHEHSERAGIVYVESGSIVEYRGSSSRTLNKGDSLIEDVKTVHSYKNTSDKDCVLIAFDLPKQVQ